MGFGLDIKQKPIEVSKEDWVEYKGILYPPNQARALKAWDTIRAKQEKQSYNRNKKNEIRKEIIKIIKQNLLENSKILTLETEEFLLPNELEGYHFFIFEKDMTIYQKMLKSKSNNIPKTNNVWLHHGDIAQVCSIEMDFNVVYLDFCCTFETAKKTIGALLEKIASCNYFGFTFCLRKNKKKLKDYKFDMIKKIELLLDEHPRCPWRKHNPKINSRLIYGEAYRDKNHSPMIALFYKNNTIGAIKKGLRYSNDIELMSREQLFEECKKQNLLSNRWNMTEKEEKDYYIKLPEILKECLKRNCNFDELHTQLIKEDMIKYDKKLELR